MSVLEREQEQEARLQELGLSNLRVTPEMLDSMIKSKDFVLQPCKTVMLCTITLHNGFKVFGINTTRDPDNFRLELAEEYSFNDARNQMWPYAAFLLAEDNYRGNAPLTAAQRELPDHIQRVIREFYQLNARLAGLTAFVNHFDTLSEDDRKEVGLAEEELADLREQESVMVKYAEVLRRRLERAGV